MTNPVAFRPTENAEKNLQLYMKDKGINKPSEAVNKILETGRFLFATETTPQPQPHNPTASDDPIKTTTPEQPVQVVYLGGFGQGAGFNRTPQNCIQKTLGNQCNARECWDFAHGWCRPAPQQQT